MRYVRPRRICYSAVMDTPRPDALDLFEPKDPAEAARLDAEAEAQFKAGEYVPHERVAAWIRSSVQALEGRQPLTPRPETEAQIARENQK